MTEEEKKAIKDLKILCLDVLRDDNLNKYDSLSPTEKMSMVYVVLNLIKKQQAEIEKLK